MKHVLFLTYNTLNEIIFPRSKCVSLLATHRGENDSDARFCSFATDIIPIERWECRNTSV